MLLPLQTIGATRHTPQQGGGEWITPSTECQLEGLSGTRCGRWGRAPCPTWRDPGRMCDICLVPEFKAAACNASGSNCGECKDNCRRDFESGGWTIQGQSGASWCSDD